MITLTSLEGLAGLVTLTILILLGERQGSPHQLAELFAYLPSRFE
jgi:hypothetical protein